MKLKNEKIVEFTAIYLLLFLSWSCASIRPGESWKMVPENNTIGLTLLWNLPEQHLIEILPKCQLPRIKDGKGVLMVFLASTEKYSLGDQEFGQLGIAHLIIPLQNGIAIPETIGLRSQSIISGMGKIGFPIKFGDAKLNLKELGDWVEVEGSIDFPKGSLSFSGRAENIKGNPVDLAQTTLVGRSTQKNLLSGPEFYRPINFKSITVNQSGENWMKDFGLSMPPDRIWVNVDFGVDFSYFKEIQDLQTKPSIQ